MKVVMAILAASSVVSVSSADNYRLLASATQLGHPPAHDTYGFSIDKNNRFNGFQDYGKLPPISFAQVVANTNSAEFVAWLAERDADATDDAALGQEMTTALVTAIAAEWPSEPQFTGERKQVRKLTRRLITESKAARQTLDDSNATIEDRLDAIAKLRRLDVISGYANQLGIGAK